MFGWFSKKVEIEIRESNGNLKRVRAPEEDIHHWIAEGRLQKISDGCQVNILDPKGDRTENWIVGRDISRDIYDQMKDAKGDLHVIVVYRQGEPEVNVVPKEIWDQAKVAFSQI